MSNPDPTVLRWETLTKSAFDRLDPARCVVLVTCSPLEVHGPHLPMGADILEGEGLALRVLRFLPDRHRTRTFLKLPAIYAATDVVPQPGSLFFRPSTTMAFLEDLGHTLARQGFQDVIVSNFHGGPRHFVAIERACERVSRRHGIRMISVFSLMLSRLSGPDENLEALIGAIPGVNPEDLVGDTHGGLLETSQLLALHGEWVDPGHSKLERLTYESWLAKAQGGRAPVKRGFLASLASTIQSFRGNVRFFEENTYSGAPAGASAEIGERILDALGSKAAEAVTEVLDGRLSPFACHSPLWRFRHVLLNPILIKLSDRLIGLRSRIA
jgi:creatinine amidohydrolase